MSSSLSPEPSLSPSSRSFGYRLTLPFRDSLFRRALLQTVIICCGYLVLGVSINGPLGPRLRKLIDLVLDGRTSSTSAWFISRGIGAMVGALFFGVVYDRADSRVPFAMSIFGMTFSIAMVPLSLLVFGASFHSWPTFACVTLSNFLIGVFIGTYDCGGNTVMPWVWSAAGRSGSIAPAIQALHFCFGLGSIMAGMLAALVSFVFRYIAPNDDLADTWSFHFFFWAMAALAFIPVIPLLVMPSPHRPNKKKDMSPVPDAVELQEMRGGDTQTSFKEMNGIAEIGHEDDDKTRHFDVSSRRDAEALDQKEAEAMEEEFMVGSAGAMELPMAEEDDHTVIASEPDGVVKSAALSEADGAEMDELELDLEAIAPPAKGEAEAEPAVPMPRIATFLLALLLLVYVGAEVGYGGLISTYVQKDEPGLRWSRESGALITSFYWGTFTLGRLLGIPLSARFSPHQIIISDIVLCILSLILFCALPRNAIALWVCTAGLGLGMASIFPSAVTIPPHYGFLISAGVTRWLVVGASTGELVVPTFISLVLDLYSPAIGYAILAAMIFVSVLYAGLEVYLRRMTKGMKQTSEGADIILQEIKR